ncbi:cyanophycinase [Pedobacter cryoconitis]|uniref:Cyanophycinase n=1 Tax=Pedobacter cryoconitis TaxID=188932 RepID=A0A7W8ZRA0_9SPHI|nr:cyanophycinase [Pedobacter cryoconitis]MBB5638761.1 cyanophycinase [Pedobacter cryoconitis]MBB6270229.1 cyanophycinase [Pedobacter cryoconitis]
MFNRICLRMQCMLLFVVLFTINQGFCQNKAKPALAKGSLFIIGGGDRSPELISALIKTAKLSKNDYIIVLPMATAEPEASFEAIKTQLSAAAKNNIYNFNFVGEQVHHQPWLDSLAGARLVFITGGDQTRFMKAVLNTPVYDAIHKAYNNGATIAGTSAGAAVMSKHMITGNQLLDTNYRETFNKLRAENIEFESGMGLLDSVIIDQHFIKRSRYNRLLSALTAYPKFDCIGIDEGTAIIVQDKNITVVGVSQVLRVADPENVRLRENHLITFDNLRFSLYAAGDKFSLK